MKPTVAAVLVVIISGCDARELTVDTAPERMRCTVVQFERVKSEADYCKAATIFSGSYCFGAALIRNCSVAPKEEKV